MTTEIYLTRRELLQTTAAELAFSALPFSRPRSLETFSLASPNVLPFAGEVVFEQAEELLSKDYPPGLNLFSIADLKFRYLLPGQGNISLTDRRRRDKIWRLYWEVIDSTGERLWISPEHDSSWQPQLVTLVEPSLNRLVKEKTSAKAYLIGGQKLTASYVLAEKRSQACGGRVYSFLNEKGSGFCFYQSLDATEVAWLVENKGVLVDRPFKLEKISASPGEEIVYHPGWGLLGGFEINDAFGALKLIIDPHTGEGWLPPRPTEAEKEILKERAWEWYQLVRKVSLLHDELIGKAIKRIGEIMPDGAFGYSGLTGYIDLLEENPPELTIFVEGKRSGNYQSTLAVGGYAPDTEGVYRTWVCFTGLGSDHFVKRLNDHWGVSDKKAITDAVAALILKELDAARRMKNEELARDICKDVTSLRFMAHVTRLFAITHSGKSPARAELMSFAQTLDRIPESCSDS